MTTCNGCGRCCDPVVLPMSRIAYQTAPAGAVEPENLRWVLEDLTPITRKEGIAQTAYLAQGGRTYMQDQRTKEVFIQHSFFFSCRWYDAEAKECRAYENRPPMCSGYPWYGAGVDPTKSLPPECSFNEDVPVKMTVRMGRMVPVEQADGEHPVDDPVVVRTSAERRGSRLREGPDRG